MKINEIRYTKEFARQFKHLPVLIKKKAVSKEFIFCHNPFHPSLRLHELSGKLDGYWSISIDRAYRIIFKVMTDGNVLFISIGTHAIYDLN